MILERTVAPVFGANCYVLAPGPSSQAVVVDPGAGAAPGALSLLLSHGLSLGAVLLTHGHADHVWDTSALIEAARERGAVAPGEGQVPVYVPAPDLYRLDDPSGTTGIHLATGTSFADLAPGPWRRPGDVRPFPEAGFSQPVELVPGLAIRAVAAPGHSEGSSLFLLEAVLADNALMREAGAGEEDPTTADQERDHLIALDGDVIFKGSVGRTDLPGGDPVQMLGTLRFLASAISPETVLLPGHGAATTMAHEHHGNPYLAEAKVRGGDLRA